VTSYLTLLEVLAIHDRLLADFGGAAGIRDPGGLESALFRPQTGYYDDTVAEAAALLESLLVNQPFVDGNKRTAFAVADIFLRLNGHRIVASSDDAYEAVVDALESSEGRFTRLEVWLRAHVVPTHAE
jgi:death on curing protein